MYQESNNISGRKLLLSTIFQLVLVLTISVGGTIIFVMPLFQDDAFESVQQWEVEYLSGGALNMLAEELNGLPFENRQQRLKKLAPQFGFDVTIEPLEKIVIKQNYYQRLLQNEVVGDPSVYSAYKLLNDNQSVLIFTQIKKPASHLVNKAERWHMGTFFLLEKILKRSTPNLWKEQIVQISGLFEFPVSLVDMQTLKLNTFQNKELITGRIVAIENDDSEVADFPADVLYKRVSDSDKVLVIGPLSEPMLERYYPVLLVFFLMISLIVVVPIGLWLNPTWRSLNRLSKATIAFGRGDFNNRATPIRGSKIRYLILLFNQMADKIQGLIESNKALVNAVSHELRTPISRIEFNIELARNSTDLAQRDKQLDRIEDSVDELKTMVSEMLQYARFDREKPNFVMESVSIKDWLTSEMKNWQISKTNIEIELIVEGGSANVDIERYYMSRAVSNLVLNATKYAKSRIRVTAKLNKGFCEIRIEDDGIGVEPNERTRIFEPFVRNDKSRNRDTGGTGLGLAIVMQIMKWHSGNVWVEDSNIGGAQFILSWPQLENKK